MLAATLYPRRFLFVSPLNWGMAVVNGLAGHILPAVLTSSYNPGAFQSLFMVPLGIYIIRKSERPLLCIANGILMHLILIMSVNIIFRFHTDEAITMSGFMLLASLVLPLAIANYVSTLNKQKCK